MISAINKDGKQRTYKYDGKADNAEINLALSRAGTITLDPGVTYDIANSLLFPSDTTLDGQGATLKLAKGLPVWGGPHVSISQEKAMLMAVPSCKNITLKNLIIDGSQSDYYPKIKLGTSCYNMATFIKVSGLTIENVTFKNGCNDAILISGSNYILIDKIRVDKCGHDGIYAYNCGTISVNNSRFINRTNSSCRFYNVSGGEFINNECSTSGGGYCGLELEGKVTNIECSGNIWHTMPGGGVAYVNAVKKNVNIHDNKNVK